MYLGLKEDGYLQRTYVLGASCVGNLIKAVRQDCIQMQQKKSMFQLQRKLKDVHNTKNNGYKAQPFAMTDSQSP